MPDIRVCQAACGTTPHPGSKPVVCLPASGHPRPPSVAISMGTAPMIAIPGAAFMGSVAMIVGSTRQVCCNHFGHGRPMIAIPPADDCGSLQLLVGDPAARARPPGRSSYGLVGVAGADRALA